jgi:hypothetical protein
MKYAISVVLILISFAIFGVRIAKKIEFKQNVTGYLKRAADANTIPLAEEELTKVIVYLENNNLTTGYTSILWKTPDEDIDFWYRNLKASQHELQNLQSESALERTNVLMKLRETLMDSGERTSVTVPEGIAVYPNNKLWALLMLLALVSGFTGFVILVTALDKAQKGKDAKKKTNPFAG